MFIYNEKKKEREWVVCVNGEVYLKFSTKVLAEKAREKVLDNGVRFNGLTGSTDIPKNGIKVVRVYEETQNNYPSLTINGSGAVKLG